MITIGQYKQKVDTTETAVGALSKDRVKPLEDRMALAETENAVQNTKIVNVADQVKAGFTEMKELMREMKKELKEDIKQKRDK